MLTASLSRWLFKSDTLHAFNKFNITLKYSTYQKLCFHSSSKILNIAEPEANVEPADKRLTRARGRSKIPKLLKTEKGILYQNLAKDDTSLDKIILASKSKKKRKKEDVIILEGKRLIKDAISAGVTPKIIVFSRFTDIHELDIPEDIVGLVSVYKAPYRWIEFWSRLTTSPGLLALCQKPNSIVAADNALPLTVVCDQIREPGNLGSILRNAAAAGVSSIILTKGCCDPWDPKVLRAGCGSHFRVPFYTDVTWEELPTLIPQNPEMYIADHDSEVTQLSRSKIPLVQYHQLSFDVHNEAVIVVGGETEGISPEAAELCNQLSGARVTIPLSNDVDSLNSAFALTLLLFEFKRQFLVSS